jgi:hypothetical protein
MYLVLEPYLHLAGGKAQLDTKTIAEGLVG